MARESLLEYLRGFERRGTEVAYVQRRGYRSVPISYRDIARRAQQFARWLEVKHIVAGDRVLLWGDDSAEWVVAFWACALRGVVVVPMDRIAAPGFARRVLEDTETKLVVGSRELLVQLAGVSAAKISFEELLPEISPYSDAPYTTHQAKRSDVLEIVFTSGTTAEPKGTVITHGNVLANLTPLETEIAKYLKYERFVHPLRFLNLLPLSHVFGQFMGVFIPQLLGATVIFSDSLSPAEIIHTIHRERVSVMVTVPRLLRSLKEKIERDHETTGELTPFREKLRQAKDEHFALRWWKFRKVHAQFGWKFWAMISGGAALDAETEEFWRRLGFVVIQGYGLTETTSLISVNHPFKVGKGSIGQVLAGREIKLDASGEILVRGENVASAYWEGRAMKPLSAADGDGWFRTGDLGELDAEGNLYFKGRSKNVIVTPEGMNVHPEDLEAELRRQPEVRDCVVIGLPRNGNAEPCAVLILEPAADAATVIERVNRLLPEFQRMRHFMVWPDKDFPRTSTQKPRVNAIAEVAIARLQGGAAVASGARDGVAELIARISGRSQGSAEGELNLSSLDRVDLLCAIEDRYQVDVDERAFSEAKTVAEVEALVRQPPAAQARDVYPRWNQRWPVTWIRFVMYYVLVWPATLLLGAPAVPGRGKLRDVRGPVLVIANHVTYLDGAFVLAALPFHLRHRLAVAMEGDRLRLMRNPSKSENVFWRWGNQIAYLLLVVVFNVFPLPQRTGVRESFRYAGECVDRGYSVLVFPEGRRTPDGKLQPFRSGIGMLAKSLNVPVVAMRIKGLWELKQRGKKTARRGDVSVEIAEPVQFGESVTQEEIARRLEAEMRSL